MSEIYDQPIVRFVWDEKYRWKQPDGSSTEGSPEESNERVVRGVYYDDENKAEAERALDSMNRREWCPAGRIHAGAGTDKRVTLLNCFVAPEIEDSMATEEGEGSAGIMDALSVAAYTQQMSGGIGMDYSTLRPRGAVVRRTGSTSSGPLPFMDMWNSMCATIMSSGSRRGAMMATLSCDHPDLEEFVKAKHERGRLTNFNVSVLVTDDFMRAVQENGNWDLGFSVPRADGKHVVTKERDGKPWFVYSRHSARSLWELITSSTYRYAEPGVIFIDRVNQWNNLYYCEHIHCTNPCFTGGTKVWTIYGHRTFRELAEAGQDIPVLTQLKEGRFVYRMMRNPRITQRSTRVVEVTVGVQGGNGKKGFITSFRCTPDHQIFLVGGGSKRAIELFKGDRISSVYRHRANSQGYKKLRGETERVMEHHVLLSWLYGERPVYPIEHCHHKNGIKSDNSLNNLVILDGSQHLSYHKMGMSNPAIREDVRQRLQEAWTPERRASQSKAMKGNCGGFRAVKNHKVISVKILDECEDVYCGTVDETSAFFLALGKDDGVLVSNCGEQPLPANGDCNLGAVNLAVMVDHPFTEGAEVNLDLVRDTTRIGVHFLDNVLDVTQYPTEEQREEALSKRRIGLGITGLGNLLQQMRIRYGSEEAISLTENIMSVIRDAAYLASVDLAKERGPFPLFNRDKYLEGQFVQTLPVTIRGAIHDNGIRNGVLLTIAPTGTTSIYYGNVSSGLEPTFAWWYQRKVIRADGTMEEFEHVEDYGYRLYQKKFGTSGELLAWDSLPDYMVTALELPVEEHLWMQAACQKYVDASISKTINCPEEMTLEEFQDVYQEAYDKGLKGCTTYRPSPERGTVLSVASEEPAGVGGKAQVVPSSRPPELDGTTYKIRWPSLDHAFYVTMNDYVGEDGEHRPFEIFINSKSVKHHEWITALTRTISAIFRRGGDVTFLLEELEQVHSGSMGGCWVDGKYVPSLVAMIGSVVRQHFRKIGLVVDELEEALGEVVEEVSGDAVTLVPEAHTVGETCQVCQNPTLYHREGCATCGNCGYSNCG